MRPDDVPFGAPGVYVVPPRPRAEELGVPMDECAFVGVAPRGPSWEVREGEDGPVRARSVAVAVRSWDEYRRVFGAFEGPGLLPLAVSAFFEQGGRVAHVVRVVPRKRATPVTLTFGSGVSTEAGGPVVLTARNEGTWAHGLTAVLRFTPTALPLEEAAAVGRELVTGTAPLAAGAVLRVTTADGAMRIRVVETSLRRPVPGPQPQHEWVSFLDQPVSGDVERVELVEVSLEVADDDPSFERVERFEHMGLTPLHPRWLGRVVAAESRLVELAIADGVGLRPDPFLVPVCAAPDTEVEDRYADITHADVVESGVPAALAAADAALLCVPDLYSPAPLPEPVEVLPPRTVAGASFDECHPLRPVREPSRRRPPELLGLRLDPTVRTELAEIVRLQGAVVDAAAAARVVALVDVPPGLRDAAVQRWRRSFSSSYAAAYHPWLLVPRDGTQGRDVLVALPPSAVAAGIIARTEAGRGLPHGPANEVARNMPGVTMRVVEPAHGELHWSNVNVFAMEPQGVVLTGARTLSTERVWRQLTARRVVSMVERAVHRRLQWAVFEPNTDTTRTLVATTVESLLTQLFGAGAFRGATPEDSYFVRTATGAASRAEQDDGRLLCEIGLAPSEPMEFLLLRVYREGDATLRTESTRA